LTVNVPIEPRDAEEDMQDPETPTPPPEKLTNKWATTALIAQQAGMPRKHVRSWLKRLKAKGLVESRYERIGEGQCITVWRAKQEARPAVKKSMIKRVTHKLFGI
jgi:predicted ArsR family transcriptional regulator